MITAEILKFIGVVVATVVAIAATYLEDTKSLDSGKLTRKGKILVGFAVLGLAMSGVAQLAQLVNAIDSAETTRKRYEDTAARLRRRSPFFLPAVIIHLSRLKCS